MSANGLPYCNPSGFLRSGVGKFWPGSVTRLRTGPALFFSGCLAGGTLRHLTPSQRAAVAVELLPELKKAAKKRQKESGKQHGRGQKVPAKMPEPIDAGEAREQAAALVSVSPRYVSDAVKLKAESHRSPSKGHLPRRCQESPRGTWRRSWGVWRLLNWQNTARAAGTGRNQALGRPGARQGADAGDHGQLDTGDASMVASTVARVRSSPHPPGGRPG